MRVSVRESGQLEDRNTEQRVQTEAPYYATQTGWAYSASNPVARYSAITTLDDLGQVGDFLPSGLTSNESQLCLYINARLSVTKTLSHK